MSLMTDKDFLTQKLRIKLKKLEDRPSNRIVQLLPLKTNDYTACFRENLDYEHSSMENYSTLTKRKTRFANVENLTDLDLNISDSIGPTDFMVEDTSESDSESTDSVEEEYIESPDFIKKEEIVVPTISTLSTQLKSKSRKVNPFAQDFSGFVNVYNFRMEKESLLALALNSGSRFQQRRNH